MTKCFKNLLISATDDIPHADEVRTLIKDIWDLRIAKLRKSIDLMVSQQEVHARVCWPIFGSCVFACTSRVFALCSSVTKLHVPVVTSLTTLSRSRMDTPMKH